MRNVRCPRPERTSADWFRPVGFLLMVLAAALIAGCGAAGGTASYGESAEETGSAALDARFSGAYPIHAVCTTGMVADIVRNVGGPHVEVTALMGEGVDPHLYKATPRDVSLLNGADAIFYSGLHLEGKMSDIFVRLARRKPTVAVTDTIDRSLLLEIPGGLHDPHVWFDVSIWSEAAAWAAESLEQFDPPHAEDYQHNVAAYRSELAELHQDCRREIATIPERQRVLVTAHDAFHYFGRAYGIDVKAIQGVSTASEASVKEINELVDYVVAHNIKAVFVETSVNERNIESLIAGCAAQAHHVRKGGSLFSDAMGRPGTPQGTYIGMVRHNVETIVNALK